jgi:uncharacterized membrane protein YjjP (DUF1212 family)
MGMMVEAGAEIYRVEESARRICAAYGIEKVDVYATTTNIIVTVEPEAGFIKTHTKRILKISTDIEKIDKLNSLVRRMSEKEIPLSTVRDEMARIKQMKEYPSLVICLFYLLIAASFYFFFGGRDPVELLVASVIGFLVGVLSRLLGYFRANKFFARFTCSFLLCALAYASYHLGVIDRVDHVIIGNIMVLIPGIGLTNALRDLFTGDSISGTLRFIEAALLALSIAGGYIITTVLFGGAV